MGSTRIINVKRKPMKCPKCGSAVWDIVYGTGELREIDIFLAYRKSVICGGDVIPRRPPIWSCSCGCIRFRKVNTDGTDAPVKVKMFKNLRREPLSKITWESDGVSNSLDMKDGRNPKYYDIDFTTELNEKSTMSVCALDEEDAKETVYNVYQPYRFGLMGEVCIITNIKEREADAMPQGKRGY